MNVIAFVCSWFKKDPFDRAMRYFNDGEYEKALVGFHGLLESQKGSESEICMVSFHIAESYMHLGAQSLREKRYEHSAALYRRALVWHPHYPDLHVELARALVGLLDFDAACTELREAIHLNPKLACAYMLLGVVAYQQKRFERAFESFHMALSLQPLYDSEPYQLGLGYHMQAEHELALAQFSAAAQVDVESVMFYLDEVKICIDLGKPEEARCLLRQALAISPGNATIERLLKQYAV